MKIPIYPFLDDIRSAYNTGSCFRSCDAVGIEKLYLGGMTAYPPNPKLDKTALGSTETVHWEYTRDSVNKIKELKSKDYLIYSAEVTTNSLEYTKVEYPRNTVIVFGNEVNGVNQQILDLSDKIIYIPMHGSKNSLNIATSFGIILYKARELFLA